MTGYLRISEYFKSDMPLALARIGRHGLAGLHGHEFSEIAIILSGTGIHFTETDEYEISAGDVLAVPRGMAHGYRDVRGLGLVNLLFISEKLRPHLLDLRENPAYHALLTLEPERRRRGSFHGRLHLSPERLSRASALIDAVEAEIGGTEPGRVALAVAYFVQLLGYLCRCYGSAPGAEARELVRLGGALGLMESSFAAELPLVELARAAHMSERNFLRAFRKATGVTPLDYLTELRLRKACRLLATTTQRVTEIAFACGFNDSNYFARKFRQKLGQTPGGYRKTNRA